MEAIEIWNSRCFTQVLAEPEFMHLTAGIVLQAYLNSHSVREALITGLVAQQSGAAVQLAVKGANLAVGASVCLAG